MKRFLGAIASLVLIIALAVAWSGAAVGLNDDSSWQAALTSRMPSAAQDDENSDDDDDEDDSTGRA